MEKSVIFFITLFALLATLFATFILSCTVYSIPLSPPPPSSQFPLPPHPSPPSLIPPKSPTSPAPNSPTNLHNNYSPTSSVTAKQSYKQLSVYKNVVVNLRSDVTTAKIGQEFSLTLSVVNLINNPNMTLQVVLQPPSGVSIVSSEFAQTGVGQYSGVFHVKPGEEKAIKIDLVPNNPGNFTIKSVIVYYFGNNKKSATIKEVDIPLKVLKSSKASNSSVSGNKGKINKIPGFPTMVCLLSLLAVMTAKMLVRRNGGNRKFN